MHHRPIPRLIEPFLSYPLRVRKEDERLDLECVLAADEELEARSAAPPRLRVIMKCDGGVVRFGLAVRMLVGQTGYRTTVR